MSTQSSLPIPQQTQLARLRQFLAWIAPFNFGFAILELIAYLISPDVVTGITAIVLFAGSGILLVARIQVQRGNAQAAATTIFAGLLGADIIIVLVQPSLWPTLAIIPLLAFMLVFPYVTNRTLVHMIGICWLVTITAVTIGEVTPAGSGSAAWFMIIFRTSSFVAVVALIFLLLWQFRSRLIDMLVQTQVAEERYALAARGANDGLWDWDLTTGQLYFSARWKAMLGYAEHEIGMTLDEWLGRVHPDDQPRVNAEIAVHIDGLTPHFESEHRIRCADGKYQWVLSRGLAVRDTVGKALRIAGSQTDMTKRKYAEEQLRYDALHDGLTGLPNRTLFMDRLTQALERAKRQAYLPFAVLFLDLDRFKVINDSLGHLAGDSLLKAIAQRLNGCMRQGDTVARLGGDEFAMLITDLIDVGDATAIAERIREIVSTPLTLNGQDVFTTTSIGIAISTTGYQQPVDMVRDADTAMYRAKVSGKDRFVVFDHSMHTRMVERLHIEMDIRRAIERHEFAVYYQPIVSLRTGKISGFEALLRWHHPSRGCLPPSEFLAVTEETGLIVPIGAWLLREACQQIVSWQTCYPNYSSLTLNVNLSAIEVAHPNLVTQIVHTLQNTGMDARHIMLEITEGVILDPDGTAMTVLEELNKHNIQLHLDDFGTGYASLNNLHYAPIKGLKIDRAFVSTMNRVDKNATIVRAIITLAHNLGLEVTAEGVETIEHLAHLRMLRCEYAQGNLFSEPLDSKGAERLLAAMPQWQVLPPRHKPIATIAAYSGSHI